MQPLVPYLLGQPHPSGTKLTSSQKCFRAQDIDEVGDNRHTTFFEMLGNWSLGDYFKQKQLEWIFEFLTHDLGLEANKLFVTVFEGNKQVPKDREAIEIWENIFNQAKIDFIKPQRIYSYPAKDNWWSRSGPPDQMPPGEPGGPSSEVFYDFGEKLRTHENSIYKSEQCHPNCDCGRFLEITNSVFMQYQKQTNGSLKELKQKNVDFGGGLERMVATTESQPDIFRTDLFWPIIKKIQAVSVKKYEDNQKSMRIIADHVKAATFLIADGVEPSNKTQGYVVRRLLRRAMVKLRSLQRISNEGDIESISGVVLEMDTYSVYFDQKNKKEIQTKVGAEVFKFSRTLDRGLSALLKITSKFDEKWMFVPLGKNAARIAFDLWQSYGLPIDVYIEEMEKKVSIAYGYGYKEEIIKKFELLRKKHAELSRTAAKGMFKGGLADHSEDVMKLHTATHLLHAALRKVLGNHVKQTGSNITAKRLRFDFTHPEKLTDQQRQKIEAWINKQIDRDLPISKQEMTLEEAKKKGALSLFGDRYGERVNVYSIGNPKTGIVSQEVCGGPHVERTGVLGRFVLGKEKAIGTGKRRLYGTL